MLQADVQYHYYNLMAEIVRFLSGILYSIHKKRPLHERSVTPQERKGVAFSYYYTTIIFAFCQGSG